MEENGSIGSVKAVDQIESTNQKELSVNILRFQPNVPTQVALQSSQGIVVEGRYGNRMMFSLVDGRVMYVPPIVATKIEAEGIAAVSDLNCAKRRSKTAAADRSSGH